ncbi:hypothetical protein F4804DRAFT_34043 [Jackrogersella minutella]|nr:hypothetical protein F4804DRAFT_34043 [Jackrogersella minutella]
MASFVVSTPSPPGRVHTPGTPKYGGYHDTWEPFSPRKSARISAQRSAQRTPSPRAPTQSRNRTSTTTKISSDIFSTPATSPQKKRQPAMDSVRRASGALTAEGTAHAADSLGISSSQQKSKPTITTSRGATMLPTPSKTPQKQPDEKAKANVRAVARSLFNEDEAIPSPKKRKTKKYTGLTLNSFTAEDVEEPIAIFTDSRDRVPEADNNAQNPFNNNSHSSTTSDREPSTRRTRANLVTIPGEGKVTIEEAMQRTDGIVYVFRGRKVFRRFESDEDADNVDGEGESIGAELGSISSPERLERTRPLTRSAIKPRLLFPSSHKVSKVKAVTKATSEDEEAVTDVEDHVLEDVAKEDPPTTAGVVETPAAMIFEKAETPVAPRFAPASPPSTVRATRASARIQAIETPMKLGKSRSPFDGWRRSKSRAAPHGQKREGEALTGHNDVSKRQRA